MYVLILERLCTVTGKLKVKGRIVTLKFSSKNPNATFVCRLNQNQHKPA